MCYCCHEGGLGLRHRPVEGFCGRSDCGLYLVVLRQMQAIDAFGGGGLESVKRRGSKLGRVQCPSVLDGLRFQAGRRHGRQRFQLLQLMHFRCDCAI